MGPMEPAYTAFFESLVQRYQDYLNSLGDMPPEKLTGPSRKEDIHVLMLALANAMQGMDHEGQYGSAYSYEDVTIVQDAVTPEIDKAFTTLLVVVEDAIRG